MGQARFFTILLSLNKFHPLHIRAGTVDQTSQETLSGLRATRKKNVYINQTIVVPSELIENIYFKPLAWEGIPLNFF